MKQTKLHFPSYFLNAKNGKVSSSAEAFKNVAWKKVQSQIKNRQGEIFFEMKNVEAPEAWSQLAVDIAASKYFRKNGVPKTKHETSVRQMVDRVVNALVASGQKQKNWYPGPACFQNQSCRFGAQ